MNPFKKVSDKLAVMFFSINLTLVLLIPNAAIAVEKTLPPSSSSAILQTNGPAGELDNGDWWANSGGGNQPHLFEIYVPCTVDSDFVIELELYDPECFKTGSELDERKGSAWDRTSFQLIAPDGVRSITEQDFEPIAETSGTWVPFASFTIRDYGCGIYQLQVATDSNDENTYAIKIKEADPDGISANGDEINIAASAASIQLSDNGCFELWVQTIEDTQLLLANFDMDDDLSVKYYTPSGDSLAGTLSGDAVWNNGGTALPPPGGDMIQNPEAGWWRTKFCGTLGNQFSFYPGKSYFFSYPTSRPELELSISNGQDTVLPGTNVTYSVQIANVGDGPALSVSVADTLPEGTTFISASHDGMVATENGKTIVNWTFDRIPAGVVILTMVGVHVEITAPEQLAAGASTSGGDILFNDYPPVHAADIDQVLRHGSISGVVWHDDNLNGIQDVSEIGLDGIELSLNDAQDNTIATAITSNGGIYLFNLLSEGTYQVVVDESTLPPGAILVHGSINTTYIVTAAGESYPDINFGYEVGLIPVELTSFTAEALESKILIQWITQSETENYGFNILRSTSKDGEYNKINQSIIPGAGSSESEHHYSYEDFKCSPGQTYYYKLQDIDYAGRTNHSYLIEVAAKRLPVEYLLHQNYPNPFNAKTTIQFELIEPGFTELIIYNLLGQQVRTLVNEERASGLHKVIWDGLDDQGRMASSGVFLYALKVNAFKQMRKMQYIR